MKLLLDECIARRLTDVLRAVLALSSDPFEVVHIHEFEGGGTADEVWAQRAAREGWFVITKDRGRKGAGPPLQIILPALGVNAAYLHRKLGTRSALEQTRSIITTLPALERAARAAPGSRALIVIQGEGFKARKWPLSRDEAVAVRYYKGVSPPPRGRAATLIQLGTPAPPPAYGRAS